MEASPTKAVLRKEALARRGALTETERQAKSAAICQHLVDLLPRLFHIGPNQTTGAPPTVFTYIPFRHEVDITAALDWCWKQGIRVAAPRTEPDTRGMRLHRIQGLDDLEPGHYGIREPKPACPVVRDDEIRIVLIPGAAFDPKGGRIGYGGGYYDRWIAQRKRSGENPPTIIAPCFETQLTGSIPMEPHDQRVDWLVTESGPWKAGTEPQSQPEHG
mgnify:CR=1 FL=1